jgi:hypothetical protein
MKRLNTSLEPLCSGKNIALGLAAEYRDVTCTENRKMMQGSHKPHNAVKVVRSNPPTMTI